jgi:hypothetical protein
MNIDEATVDELRLRGHEVQVAKPPLAAPSVLQVDSVNGSIRAAGDPKAGRHAGAL